MFIIGAGPAGLCAALRLQQLGYRVALIERSALWPRTQIGEALTPGVKNIIDFLDANEALENVPHLTRLPTRLCWRSTTPEMVSHADSAIVDRSAFDAALLQLVIQRGGQVYQPATLQYVEGCAGDWQLTFSSLHNEYHINAQMILDAQGRQSNLTQQLVHAPRLSAMWIEVADNNIPPECSHLTHVEALEHGWLWGTHLPNHRYRVMLLSDPATSRRLSSSQPESWLRTQCASSRLFAPLAVQPFANRLQVCSATPYMAYNSWQEGRLKLGDAAFAIDPISSSGVEKAMRFSLQAVVAIHTACQESSFSQQSLAREFYQRNLIETYARHHFWTASYYQQAWCSENEFWQVRSISTPLILTHPDHHDAQNMANAFHQKLEQLTHYREPELKQYFVIQHHHIIHFHHEVAIVTTPCVTDNQVELIPALQHPHLERPVAFWENEALLPRLGILSQKATLSAVLAILNQSMSMHKAQRLLVWLWQWGLLETHTQL